MAQDNEIQGQDSERVAAILNQQKADARRKEEQPDTEKENEDTEEAGGDDKKNSGLRQRIASAKEALNLKAKAKKALEDKVTAPMKKGTGMLLRWAWLNIVTSLGLTIIYINMHAFLRLALPSAFCKLGEEWIPKQVAPESSKNIAGTAFGIVEIMGLIMIDALIILVIGSFVTAVGYLAYYLGYPLIKVSEWYDLLTSGPIK